MSYAHLVFLQPHKISIEKVDLRPETNSPISSPTPLPVNSPTTSPVIAPSFSPTISSAPTGNNILGYGSFELDPSSNNTSTDPINGAWPSSCETNLLDVATDNPDDIYAGSKSLNVTGGRCSVLRMMGRNCPSTRMTSDLQPGDTVKISLWVKMSQPGQVFQMLTAHFHTRKSRRWERSSDPATGSRSFC